MSLTRAALHACPRPTNTALFLQNRLASSAVNRAREDHDSDGTQDAQEGV
jgi:hypothetical protein